ncbi:pantoate--beta-alanine ligase [Sphingomonas humi]|uniref:pantoate--beta-alanine ligase n=1 Tax=Sphingomonas humi TaxID=335630 RepID=UPI0031DCF761
MQIIRELGGLKPALGALRGAGDTLALVPTMGALHDGHLALVAEAGKRAGRVAATIFVNPLQFNDAGDLARYPRQEETDLAKLEEAGCDLVWLPSPDQLYPQGFATNVSVRGVSERWEGEHRPGHFDGVATVVAKLLLAMRPDIAIFGEKDWQQLAVIRRMEADLGLGVAILGYPTVREADGLAMSSRNALLGAGERRQAAALPAAMLNAARRIGAGEPAELALRDAREALVAGGFSKVDYLALVDGGTLAPVDNASETTRMLAAASIGSVRLIDNIAVTSVQQSGG